MMRILRCFWGLCWYEFRMQIARPGLWLVFGVMCYFVFCIVAGGPAAIAETVHHYLTTTSISTTLAGWAFQVNTFLPISVGVMIADRLPRDRRTRVVELLSTLPNGLGNRLLSVYLGNVVASVLPMFLLYLLGVLYMLSVTRALMVIPLYQFLFLAYWLWGNTIRHPTLYPTLSFSVLTPDGKYMANGFYGMGLRSIPTSPMLALMSMSLLIITTCIVLYILWYALKWQQTSQ